MANEKNRKRIIRIVALIIVAVMLLSVFSGIFLIFMSEYRAKQNAEALAKLLEQQQSLSSSED